MSGIMEQVLAEVQAINARLDAMKPLGGVMPELQQQQPVQQATPPADPLTAAGLTAQAPAAPTDLTDDKLMSLIEPYLANLTIKTGLQQVLANMGIPRLPEAKPEQYAELYQRFQAVIQQHSGAAANGGGGII